MTKFDVELKKVLKQVYNQYESKFKGEIGQTAFIQQFVPEREKEEQPKTGFILWSKDNRDAVTEMIQNKHKSLPDDQKLSISQDIMVELGRRWREDISTKEKDKYNKKAADEKKKLDEKKSADKDSKDAKDAAKKEIDSKTKSKTKPRNGYHAFITDPKNRAEAKTKNPTLEKDNEINKYLTGEWKKKSKEEKAEYTAEVLAASS